ncbi:hypothetical protein BC332_23026 [Capsicum chinense]|nr:hypothetical protein BC332_23026 [Capsicum chinense]
MLKIKGFVGLMPQGLGAYAWPHISAFWKIMDAIIGNVVDFGMKKFKSTIDFDENLETLERNVKLLSDKAVDVKTEVKNQEQYGKKKRKREVASWFDELKKIKKGLRVLKEEVTVGKKNGGTLEKMNGRVGELLEQSKHLGTLVHIIYEGEECQMMVQQVHEETSKQNLEVIWTWLQDENVSSIGIYGLQDSLSKIVKLDLSDVEDERKRADQLNWAFKKMKNIVIILDDVWDCLRLEKLGYPLGVEGCRLILTSRSSEVCQKMSCKELLQVKKLNTDDAWELFRKSLGSET